jgi:hypothetical protein
MTHGSRIRILKTNLVAATMGALLSICAPANATLIGYQSQAAFNAAISGWTTTSTNFESVPAGTGYSAGTGPAGSGFTLTLSGPDAPGLIPTVANLFWSTSGTHYLGLDNSDTAFEAGDSLTINFGTAMQAFGLFVIGTSDIGAGDISLVTGASSVLNGAVADMSDGNGSFAYFLGFVSDDGGTFNSIVLNDLTLSSARLLNIAVDDIVLALNNPPAVIPEPGTLVLMLMGLLALGTRIRHSVRQSLTRQTTTPRRKSC